MLYLPLKVENSPIPFTTSTFLEKQFHFYYTPFMRFPNNDSWILGEKVKHITIEEEWIEYGKHYHQELINAYMPPSSIRFVSEEIGFGLFTDIDLEKGAYVGEYTGLFTENDPYSKMLDYSFRLPVPDYIGRDHSIDAEEWGNHTRFINHSFKPNLKPTYAYFRGLLHPILIANQHIPRGTQLSYSYGQNYWHLRGAPALI